MSKLIAAASVLIALIAAPAAMADSTAGFETSGNELLVNGTGDGQSQTITLTHNGDGSYTITDNTGITPDPNTAFYTGCSQGANANTVNCNVAGAGTFDVRILSGDGADTINAGYSQTAAAWGAANVYVDAGAGDDTVLGSPSEARPDEQEADYLNGNQGDDVIDGNAGDDFITGGSNSISTSSDELSGGDALFGGPGSDTIMDGDGNTDGAGTISNINEDDTVDGGICPAVFSGCAGTAVEGAGDSDTIAYADDRQSAERTGGVAVDLDDFAAPHGETGEGDTVRYFENVVGTAFLDALTGNPSVNRIDAGGGNDLVDTVDTVADTVDCGDGTDDSLTRDSSDLDITGCESIDPPIAGPAAPTGLTATAVPGGGLELNWDDVAGATEYAVYLKREAGYTGYPGAPLSGSFSSDDSLTGFIGGVTYCFKVAAVNDFGVSGLSNEACVTAVSAPSSGGGGGGTGGTAGGGGTTPVGPTSAQVGAAVSANASKAASVLRKLGLIKLLSKRVTIRGTAPEPGRVIVYYTVRYFISFKASSSATRSVRVLSGAKTLTAAGPYSLKLKASKKARRRLRGVKRAKATVTVQFRGVSGKKATRKKTFAIKRR